MCLIVPKNNTPAYTGENNSIIATVFTKIKGLLTYKEPKKTWVFELLEPDDMQNSLQKNQREIADEDYWQKRKNPPDNTSAELQININTLKKEFHADKNHDLIIREFKVLHKTPAAILYIPGMADTSIINKDILRTLMKESPPDPGTKAQDMKQGLIDHVYNNLLSANYVSITRNYDEIINNILDGLTALFIHGYEECLIIETRGYEKRSITTPQTEMVIKGSHEAFIEDLRTNITLIRRQIHNKNLITEKIPIGNVDQLNCAIMYIEGIANPRIVAEVKRRITSIDVDHLSGDGTLNTLIEDNPNSLIPVLISTERPDRCSYFLTRGSICIICDTAPFATIGPITFFDQFHTSEDANLRWQYTSFLRIFRFISAIIGLLLPGIFIALTNYHQEMIPTVLLISFNIARENIPFPSIFELLIMEISFEIIREAGLRVPGSIGQTLGIIGAVILGQAAVEAGVVSPILIIIVSITGLCSFSMPNYGIGFGIRILRFFVTIASAIAGFYGIMAAVFILGISACSMKSFGVPYFSPIAPKTFSEKNMIIRAPNKQLKQRPDFLNTRNRMKTKSNIANWYNKQSPKERK